MDKSLQDALDVARHVGLTDRDIALAVAAATEVRRAEADAPELVTMDHPALPDQPIRVLPDAVEHHQRSGWQVRAEAPPDDQTDEQPKGNASRDEWETYALALGFTAEDLEPLTRDQIRDQASNRSEKSEESS